MNTTKALYSLQALEELCKLSKRGIKNYFSCEVARRNPWGNKHKPPKMLVLCLAVQVTHYVSTHQLCLAGDVKKDLYKGTWY